MAFYNTHTIHPTTTIACVQIQLQILEIFLHVVLLVVIIEVVIVYCSRTLYGRCYISQTLAYTITLGV